MSAVSVGIDFGTSNTAAALPGVRPDAPARVLEIDPPAEDPRLLRSILFFPEDSAEILVGATGIERYLHEGGGRLLQSVKSLLPSTSFQTTEIRRQSWTLENLVARLLGNLRERIEAVCGAPVGRLVLGRPAAFSDNPEEDRLAEERLAKAARAAGFPQPVFLIEPIAAALRYEESLERDETVLVADFGAGTSDFTLIRLGPSRRHRVDRTADVIASAGVPIGGDRFDSAIVEHRLLPVFGHGTTFQNMTRRQTLPVWLTRRLLTWYELSLLRERTTMAFLKRALQTSDSPERLNNLIALAEENLAYHLYRAVEEAKRRLSSEDETTLSFDQSGIRVEERITRSDFEEWTLPLRRTLSAVTQRVLDAANGVEPDAVFLTGGTSNIPSVRALFVERFGAARIKDGDAFTSVAAGLGRMAADPALRLAC